MELYVQALTTDLNLLERQKNENDKVRVRETSKRIARGLLQLAEVLKDHINVCRECVLTSFSLRPTRECMRKIEDIARKSGHKVLDTGQWKCKFHPPLTKDDELALQCDDCGGFMAPLQLNQALNTNTVFSEALTAHGLGLSPELCDDLVVIVCSPRYQLLSWSQEWKYLQRLCMMYMDNPERTKNVVTELKFLDIDYSIFMNIKKEPESGDEAICDQAVDPDYSEDYDEPPKPKKKRGRKKKIRESSEDESYLPYVAPKSDPQVLKTLRSFRRTFKRKIDNSSDNSVEQAKESDRAQNFKYPKHGEFNTANFTNSNDNNNFTTHRTFSELAFRAHEELITQGLYPKDMYHDSARSRLQQTASNSEYPQMPCTSKEYAFNYYDNQTKQTLEQHMEEHNLMMNDFTNEITVTSDNSPTEESRQIQNDSILKSLILASNNNNNNSNPKNELINKYDDYKMYNTSSNFRSGSLLNSNSKLLNHLDSETYAKDYSMKTLNLNNGQDFPIGEKKRNTSTSVLTEENPHINPDGKRRDSPPKESPEKSLFREKLIETVFAEENGKVTKKHKEKKSESICNKENSRFISKKKTNKNHDNQKTPDKLSPKPVKKSEIITDILDVPKKTVLNFQDVFQESLKIEKAKDKSAKQPKIHSKEIKLSKTFKDHNFQSDPTVNKDATSVSEDAFDNLKNSSQGQNNNKIDNNTKIRLKELRVILHRINFKFPVKKSDLFNDPNKSPKKVQSNRDKFKSRKDDRRIFNTFFNNNVQSQENDLAEPVKPLQDKDLKVIIQDDDIIKPNLVADYLKYETEKMKKSKLVPRVVLERLNDSDLSLYSNDDNNKNERKKSLSDPDKLNGADAKSVLANVPGLNDTELIQPAPVDSIVQVVQIAGGRSNATVNSTNTQTSTQVSPHIQRIGQPRDKPETSETATNVTTIKSSTSNSKPSSTQSPTLINILSQQIIRPGQSTNSNRPLSGPLINILSQQVIRPANTTATPTKTTTTISSSSEESQVR